MADAEGGILIANHPFRYWLDAKVSFMNGHRQPLDPSEVESAAGLEIFQMADAVEVLNGACSEEENLFALRVARHLGLAEVAGSDSRLEPVGGVRHDAVYASDPQPARVDRRDQGQGMLRRPRPARTGGAGLRRC